MDKPEALIRLIGIDFAHEGGAPVLKNLHFTFFKGQKLGLIAPNGSGKTTLFHLIMGLLPPQAGEIELFGNPMKTETDFVSVRPRIGLLFQDADDQLFCPTVLEDVCFGPLNLGKSKNEAIAIARRTLAMLGLSGFESRLTFKLSGGEKKLVSLATVLSLEPEILLLDEPLNGLDARTRGVIRTLLAQMPLSYIIISHNIEFLNQVTTEVYTLREGTVMLDDRMYVHLHDHAHAHGNVPHQHETRG